MLHAVLLLNAVALAYVVRLMLDVERLWRRRRPRRQPPLRPGGRATASDRRRRQRADGSGPAPRRERCSGGARPAPEVSS